MARDEAKGAKNETPQALSRMWALKDRCELPIEV